MSLGNDLYSACKKSGLSQEDAAEKQASAAGPCPNMSLTNRCRIFFRQNGSHDNKGWIWTSGIFPPRSKRE